LKKRVVALVLAFMMIVSVGSVASARASDYLSSYTVALDALGNGEMEIFFDVDGTGTMTKIGAQVLYVDEYVNGAWSPYLTLAAVDNDDFYGYNTAGHIGLAYFDGTPGVKYRVTLVAYARNSSGSDTGSVTSPAVYCR